jgi:hypothetical protein
MLRALRRYGREDDLTPKHPNDIWTVRASIWLHQLNHAGALLSELADG